MTQPLPLKGFSDFDFVISQALREFMTPDSLLVSATANKSLQKLMADKQTWVAIAKKLNIPPSSPETAKQEVARRLRINKHFLTTFRKCHVDSVRNIKKLDPFEQNDLIQFIWNETLANKDDPKNTQVIQNLFATTLKRITDKSGTKEGVDPFDMEMASQLIHDALDPENSEDWELLFNLIPGYKVRGFTYHSCPEHFILFKESMNVFKNSQLSPYEKQVLVEPFFQYSITFPPEYPYNYIEEILKAGVRPGIKFFATAEKASTKNWEHTKGENVKQLIKFATNTEIDTVLKESEQWLALWQKEFKQALKEKNTTYAFETLNHLIHWPDFTAFLRKTVVSQIGKKKILDWVNQQIDAAEKKALSGAEKKRVKEYYDSIREKVKELTLNKEAL